LLWGIFIQKNTQYVDYGGKPIDVIYGDAGGFEIADKEKVYAGIAMLEKSRAIPVCIAHPDALSALADRA
jgi:hypothetical protein